MKISVDNFKTLKSLEEFEFLPFTIITGVNSSGKSSFIQLLLLLKQTLNTPTTNIPLNLNGNLVNLGSFEDIIYQKNTQNDLSVTLSFDSTEYSFADFGRIKIESCDMKISFHHPSSELGVKSVEFSYYIPDALNRNQFLKFTKSDGAYQMAASTALFNSDFTQLLADEGKDFITGDVLFSSFFPQLFTTQVANSEFNTALEQKTDNVENKTEELLNKAKSGPFRQYSIVPNTKFIEEFITKWFDKISYIGPLREEPGEYYNSNKRDSSIGKKGEFAAYILEREARELISFMKLDYNDEGAISLFLYEDTFLNAVNYWICDVFKLAKKIYSVESEDSYQVLVVNNYDFETTIKHVGFGVSQILPIIVEGLRISTDSILILEQPEIHLHPKIQGQLFDFFYSLLLRGKKLLIETHSDHLIVRMRRRIAEDEVNNLFSLVNLEFVETGDTSHYFESVAMNELGSIKEFPRDFIEQQEDYRAIVKAQARKNLK